LNKYIRYALCALAVGCWPIAHLLAVQTSAAVPAKALDSKASKSASPSFDAAAHPELARLELILGSWSVAETHYDRRGHVVATVKGAEEVAWILDHHVIRRSYQTETGSGLYRASGMLTYNATLKEYRGVWFDNVSDSGPSHVKGDWLEETKSLVFTLESIGADGETRRYKIVEQFPDEQRRIATTYLLSGDEVVKKMEVTYVRTIPCPARIRGVFNELAGPGKK
jgi:hypothetical protein